MAEIVHRESFRAHFTFNFFTIQKIPGAVSDTKVDAIVTVISNKECQDWLSFNVSSKRLQTLSIMSNLFYQKYYCLGYSVSKGYLIDDFK